MKVYKIVHELPNRRAIINGEFKDLPIDAKVVIEDGRGNLYDAIVQTRSGCGVVVGVSGLV